MNRSIAMRTIGIDIGGTSVKMAVFEGGLFVDSKQSEPYTRPDTDQLVRAIAQTLGERPVDVDVVGLCVPGLIDRASGVVTLSVNVPGLVGVPLSELLGLAIPGFAGSLKIVNDALAAGVDVVARRKLPGRVLVLALGTGVGAAVLDDGVELRVEPDSPGHIGQMDVSLGDSAPIGPDGGAGSLEAYLGTAALIREYGSMERFFRDVTVEDASMRSLVRAIRICHAIYRPAHVVLVGGVGIRLKHQIDALKVKVDDHLTSVARPDWKLLVGDDDFHAARGAARLAEEEQKAKGKR
jgi:predicted NBD/HSP70 family sugar kinase